MDHGFAWALAELVLTPPRDLRWTRGGFLLCAAGRKRAAYSSKVQYSARLTVLRG